MIHPDTALGIARPEIGFGVFATRWIPRGTITWARDRLDQILPNGWAETLPAVFRPSFERYTYRNSRGDYVLCWDIARYMNHSCAPTCLGTGFGFEVAVRDIAPGEELTDDYATLHLEEHESFACRCGAPECRGWIGPGDVAVRAEDWRRMLVPALATVPLLSQPLWPFLGKTTLKRAWAAHGLTARDLTPARLAALNGAALALPRRRRGRRL